MVAVSFPLSSAPGRHAQESAGRLVNAYAEPLGEGARSQVAFRRVSGLTGFATSSQTGFRGMLPIPGTLFAGFENRIYKVASGGGAMTLVGTLSGTKPLIWARNNLAPAPNIVAVDPENGAFLVTESTVTDYPDADIGQPNGICFLQGYFFTTYGNGQTRSSGLNATAIDPLDFATAESNVDGLLRPIPWNDQLFLFGDNSFEVWSGNTPNPTNFPFNKVVAVPRGLLGRYAIAGHETGFGKALLWVGDHGRVCMTGGQYQPEDVSPPDLDRLIADVADPETLEATVYVANGVPRWVLSSPDWTWEFNLNTAKWSERQSYLSSRWRGTQAAYVAGKWLCGDTQSGNILEIDAATRTEAGDPLRMRIESGPVAKFPSRVAVSRVDVDVTVGIGIAAGAQPNQTDPVLELSMSRDGGVNWDIPRLIQLGKQAIATQLVYATRFGTTSPQGARVRIDVSDPVDVAVMGAELQVMARQG